MGHHDLGRGSGRYSSVVFVMALKHLLLALWLTPVWCFEQRCEIGEPLLIERSYLRPSFVLCLLPSNRKVIYVCRSTPWSAM
ncbi:MAG TPA: hypothetical protein VGK56_12475 [Anaerolineales bacterium]